MCKHQYSINSFQAPKECYLVELIAQQKELFGFDLPMDNKDLCLFHSENEEWKNENLFEERLVTLFEFMKDDKGLKEIDFRGFYMISQKEKGLEWNDLTITKPLNLGAAKFKCEFHLTQSHLAGDVYMDEVEMDRLFVVEHCDFSGNFTAVNGAIFHSNVYLSEVTFVDLFDIKHAKFFGQVNMSPVRFQGYTVFDHCYFYTKRGGLNYFHFITTNDQMSFKETVFKDAVQFDQCEFRADTYFDATVFKEPLHIEKPIITSNVFFKGESVDKKIFENEVVMVINSTDFEKTGQIVFENANLLNLDSSTKQKLTLLKAQRRIELGKGTIVFRVSFEHKYKDIDLTELFLKDLLSTIRNYFGRKLSKHFEFVFRKEGNDLVVTFFTDDYADTRDFELDYEKTKDEISDKSHDPKESILDYLKDKFLTDADRIIATAVQEKLNASFMHQLLNDANFKVILEGTQINTIQAEQLFIDQVKDSTFYIAKLNGLTNQPEFKLSTTQFLSLKNEFSKLTKEQWAATEKLLKEIKDNQDQQSTLIPFLTERGIRISDGLSAGIIMLFLKHLIMM